MNNSENLHPVPQGAELDEDTLELVGGGTSASDKNGNGYLWYINCPRCGSPARLLEYSVPYYQCTKCNHKMHVPF